MEDKLKAVLKLVRPRNMAISFLGVVVGMLLVSNTTAVEFKVFLAAVSAMLILGGGNALNDYYDVDADRVNRPQRPITSGMIKRENARLISILLFLAGISIAFFINHYCLLLAVINSGILAAYAKYSKKAFLVSNIAVSYLTASVFIYGGLSIYQTTQFNPLGVETLLVLLSSSFFMTFSREIIKDIEDVEGDSKIRAKTLPTKIGNSKSKNIAVLIGATAVLISLTPLLRETINFNKTAYALFITPANLIFISSYLTNPAKSQRHIVLGMLVSLLAFTAGRLM